MLTGYGLRRYVVLVAQRVIIKVKGAEDVDRLRAAPICSPRGAACYHRGQGSGGCRQATGCADEQSSWRSMLSRSREPRMLTGYGLRQYIVLMAQRVIEAEDVDRLRVAPIYILHGAACYRRGRRSRGCRQATGCADEQSSWRGALLMRSKGAFQQTAPLPNSHGALMADVYGT
jgi:hypothetical protein